MSSSPPEHVAYLEDMRLAALDAIEFLADADAALYASTPIMKAAVERQLTIIGEALVQLARSAPHVADRFADKRDIIAMRNIIVHGYRVIDHARIHCVVRQSLPALVALLDALIAEAVS